MKFQNTTDWSDAFLRKMLRWVCKEVELPIRFIKGIKFRNRTGSNKFSGRCWHWRNGSRIVVSIGPESYVSKQSYIMLNGGPCPMEVYRSLTNDEHRQMLATNSVTLVNGSVIERKGANKVIQNFPWTDEGKSSGIKGIVRTLNDRIEALVNVTAHEVRHAYAEIGGERSRGGGRRTGSSERATEHTAQQVLAKFRENREQLLAEWGLTQTTTPVEPSTVVPDAPKQKSGLTIQERNEAKARRMLEAWERKLRLAKTKVGKYRRKVRRYERIAATKQAKP